MSTDRSVPGPRAAGAAKRGDILRAAEQLFLGRWVHELTLDDVAAAAGVSKGTIYRFFRNKEDLLFQLAAEGFDELCAVVSAPPPGDLGFERRLVGLCRHISDFFDRRRAALRMIQEQEGRLGGCRHPRRARWLDHRRRLVRAVSDVLAEGIREGAVRAGLAAPDLARMLLGMLRARGRDYEGEPGGRPDLEWIVALFLRGAGAAPRRSGRTS